MATTRHRPRWTRAARAYWTVRSHSPVIRATVALAVATHRPVAWSAAAASARATAMRVRRETLRAMILAARGLWEASATASSQASRLLQHGIGPTGRSAGNTHDRAAGGGQREGCRVRVAEKPLCSMLARFIMVSVLVT